MNDLLKDLPGEELIRPGIADLAAGKLTVNACLAAIGGDLLHQAGFLPEPAPRSGIFPEGLDIEIVLYRLLRQEEGDAYSRYNSLMRRLVSLERALRLRLRKSV